jgi:hypothetical protein
MHSLRIHIGIAGEILTLRQWLTGDAVKLKRNVDVIRGSGIPTGTKDYI